MSLTRYENRIVLLRKRARISLRELSRKADLAPASLSAIERGLSSPTLATFHKILRALGTDFAEFFTSAAGPGESPVFKAADMTQVKDALSTYALLFPKRADLKFEMIRETIRPAKRESEWLTLDLDVGGLVLAGGPFVLEIEQRGRWTLEAGDAFYILAGSKHRSGNLGRGPVQLVTVCCPPRF
jgi:transcriptional regulator with XRE-family HTH domain